MSLMFSRAKQASAVVTILLVAIWLASFTACNSTKSSPPANSQMTSTQTSNQSQLATPAASNESNAEAPDPCKLLTKEESAVVLGEPVRDPQPGNISDTKYCDYKAIKLYGGIMPASVHIALSPMKRSTWDIGKQSTFKSNPKETKQVDGLGEDAYYEGESLVIFDKDLFVTVEVAKNFDKPDHHKVIIDAMKQVAQKIVPRL